MSTRDEVIRLIEEDVTNLRKVDRKWVRDKEFMREVLQYHPQCLKYCSHEIVNDREIVEMVVSRNGHFLKFASHQLRSDPELVEMACMNNIAAIDYSLVPWNTLQEKIIVLRYYIKKRKSKNNQYDRIAHVPSKFCEDLDVMFEAASTFGNSLGYAKGDLVNNHELIFKAVQTNPSSVRNVPAYLLSGGSSESINDCSSSKRKTPSNEASNVKRSRTTTTSDSNTPTNSTSNAEHLTEEISNNNLNAFELLGADEHSPTCSSPLCFSPTCSSNSQTSSSGNYLNSVITPQVNLGSIPAFNINPNVNPLNPFLVHPNGIQMVPSNIDPVANQTIDHPSTIQPVAINHPSNIQPVANPVPSNIEPVAHQTVNHPNDNLNVTQIVSTNLNNNDQAGNVRNQSNESVPPDNNQGIIRVKVKKGETREEISWYSIFAKLTGIYYEKQ